MIPEALTDDPRLTLADKHVYAVLLRYGRHGVRAWPTRERIEADAVLSRAAVTRSLAALRAVGWVTREKVGPNKWATVVNSTPGGSPQSPAGGSEVSLGGLSPEPWGGSEVSRAKETEVVQEKDLKTPPHYVGPPSASSSQLSLISEPLAGDVIHDPKPVEPKPGGQNANRGSRLSPEFMPTAKMIEWAQREAPGPGMNEHARFVDYWIAIPGQRGLKLNWEATWRNWMRRASDRLMSVNQPINRSEIRTIKVASLAEIAAADDEAIEKRKSVGQTTPLFEIEEK